jgi:hypothetical protein
MEGYNEIERVKAESLEEASGGERREPPKQKKLGIKDFKKMTVQEYEQYCKSSGW